MSFELHMIQAQATKQSLDKMSFLIGDWTGTGTLEYPGPPVKKADYNILSMCKFSPDKNQLVMVTFNDDPNNHTMFHATQSFIYVDRESGQLRARRQWLMDSDNEGFVTVDRISEKDQGNSLGFTVIAREGVPDNFQHNGTIERISDDELRVSGEVKFNGRVYPYVDKYVRRTKPKE